MRLSNLKCFPINTLSTFSTFIDVLARQVAEELNKQISINTGVVLYHVFLISAASSGTNPSKHHNHTLESCRILSLNTHGGKLSIKNTFLCVVVDLVHTLNEPLTLRLTNYVGISD